MLFHTPLFLFIFLPTTLILYYLVRKYSKIYHIHILVFAGFVFYAYWNIYLSPLIIVSILCNFFFGKLLRESIRPERKKKILFIAIFLNVLFLAIFKYSYFIIENINFIFNLNLEKINFPFPLAMSFFTFQTIAFLVDCYDGNIKKCDLPKYSLFIIFFPQLIAGPIVRYNHMVPQFVDEQKKSINKENFILGLIIILIGLFKKIIIADNLSIFVDNGFANHQYIDFISGWLTSLCFTFQIYFDFSGYIDMATGIALLFNINLPRNFDSPFKATSIINFWQRWHITLSKFLMNYIYFPWTKSLKKTSFVKAMLITFFVFLIAGIWHGPSWTFVIFGGLHGFGIIINHISRKLFQFKLNKIFACFFTFNYINFVFIFFRSENLTAALNIIKGMIGINGFNYLNLYKNDNYIFLILLISIFLCFFFKNVNYFLENFKLKDNS